LGGNDAAEVFPHRVIGRVLSFAVLFLRREEPKDIEVLVPHELEILRRDEPGPRLELADRVWLAPLSASRTPAVVGVRPAAALLAVPLGRPP
jgi:hypothetical protein